MDTCCCSACYTRTLRAGQKGTYSGTHMLVGDPMANTLQHGVASYNIANAYSARSVCFHTQHTQASNDVKDLAAAY